MTENLTSVETTTDWASLQGVILDGGCELKDVLEVRDNAATMRVRILGSGGRMGVAYLLQLDPQAAEDQLDIWETVREIRHPNLSRPLAVGRRDVGGVDTIYTVLGDPDEKLLGVIPERPLEWEEAAEVLHSVELALAQLHACRLVHGSVSPETVEAVGYTILLSTEGVRRLGSKPPVEWAKPRYYAPESAGINNTTQADVWCLGATLFEVLAQEQWGTPGAELEKGLPLGGVIARCLDKNPATRCTLKEAPAFVEPAPAAVLEPEPQPVEVAPEPIEAAVETPAETVPPVEVPPQPVEAKPEPIPVQAAPTVAPSVTPTVTPNAPPKVTPSVTPSTNGKPVVEAPRRTPDPRPLTPGVRHAPPAARPAPPVASPAARGPVVDRPRTVLPPPLTPPPARQVAKDDMALVPLGKRHRAVQGKRQPIDARIKTLDRPTREGVDELDDNPSAKARMLGLGRKAGFGRGIVAGGLAVTALLALVFLVVIPHFQTPTDQPVVGESPAKIPGMETASPAPTFPPLAQPSPVPAVQTVTPGGETAYRVVLSTFTNPQDAAAHSDLLAHQHPEASVHVLVLRGSDRYLVVAGGAMSLDDANALRERLVSEGVPRTAHVEGFQK